MKWGLHFASGLGLLPALHGPGYKYISKEAIKNLLVVPKDKDTITKKSVMTYSYRCDRMKCDEEYIGEFARTFEEKFKEQLKAPSPMYEHSKITGHHTSVDNLSIVGGEVQNLTKAINAALFIIVNDPSLNRNTGKYQLPHVWDKVLFNT